MFRLLGPLGLQVAEGAVDLGPAKQRIVLAVLLAEAGRTVAMADLAERVWGDEAPTDARNALYTYVSRLRRVLERAIAAGEEPALLVRRSGGYVLEMNPDRVDVHRFRRLVATGLNGASRDVERAALLREALELWRGVPLVDVPGEWAVRMRAGWCQEHLEATVAWANVELRLDSGTAVVGPLTDMVAQHPLDEPLLAALVRSLHAAGRSAEALDCYARIRRRMLEELGAEPGPELQAVHLRILRERPAAIDTTVPGTRPAQIPPAVAAFSGQTESLNVLDTMVPTGGEAVTPTVIAVVGTAGVGKTALVVHWAHRMVGRFPDGQLHVNLRGYAVGQPVRPIDALGVLLRSLGVRPDRVPVELSEATALYRSMLAGRRVLVLLDNARTADQVRPLLPGSSGCLVLVTSRDRLGGLVARDGALRITLDMLTPGEARVLLERLIGQERIRAESQAAADLAAVCAYLPLALRIAAANLTGRPYRTISEYVTQLRGGNRLAALSNDGDEEAAVRVAFDLSYQSVSAEAQRLFRLLGLVPGVDVTAAAAAALTDITPAEVAPLLDELAAAHLIDEHAADRFTFHDLLRHYAREHAVASDNASAVDGNLADLLSSARTSSATAEAAAGLNGRIGVHHCPDRADSYLTATTMPSSI
ncbi:winged helix-turn-helix domain-containing protein [Micromonospora sp. NIE79]|uniref:Winged helix-turn-helix domain-containing protein n=1 Tax=Micromonospora trifolii TaxID=2911208 RepID=A0ABS9N3J2_9ACTN|nr:AfsR/SARP family transcriptional regulator [Micromonospora trifolii]MCG5444514.1 winged helix-turn-helix domain-containing protein [Micromonospora trifolii]